MDANEIQSAMSELQRQREHFQREIELINKEIKLKSSEIQAQESRFRDLKEQIMKIQLKQSEVVLMEQSKKELEANIVSLNAEIVALDVVTSDTTKELEAAQDKRSHDSLVYADREQRARQELSAIEQNFQSLESIASEVERYAINDPYRYQVIESKSWPIQSCLLFSAVKRPSCQIVLKACKGSLIEWSNKVPSFPGHLVKPWYRSEISETTSSTASLADVSKAWKMRLPRSSVRLDLSIASLLYRNCSARTSNIPSFWENEQEFSERCDNYRINWTD